MLAWPLGCSGRNGPRAPRGQPDGLTAVALEIHLSMEPAAPLEANERLADAGGTLPEGVAELTSKAVGGIACQFAALFGDVLEDPVAQRFSHGPFVPSEAVCRNPRKARTCCTERKLRFPLTGC